ncbi:ribonuclease D [Solemya pervernicosa gill symbiont]|uniref:Ribonuclease D n=2 Tax=Gammaproteobacteria incertae sedis TaxID=118884 RepID=A0A1T2L7D5_9GAMM|nr:ribonuclease D [Candidatus Reidiella endopervernicosa]OOZ41019.1 ribonuclease D [Solemya pervernicosa gill symbiont]QKQ25078.1 ribonuclease D [Candidatus Reidiella endopervernicosa]
MDTLYIETPAALTDLCNRLSGAEWIAIDTEFMRETTYYPKLCLLQVGIPGLAALVDPLALDNLDPLLDLLYDPKVTKVLHACRQDLEILFHMRGELPAPIFDTQIAAPLLGYQEQIGYASLVEKRLNISVDKSHTRADWTHRPLSEAEQQYAANDVIHLCALYPELRSELEERGRLAWLDDDFTALSDPALYVNAPEKAWLRIKMINKFRGVQLAVLQALAQWREQTAQNDNRPRNRLMRDDALGDIARMTPDDMESLARIRGLHERLVKRYGKSILDLIKASRENEPKPLPAFKKPSKPSIEQEALVDLLNAVVHLRAAEQQLSPTQLAPRKQLQQLVMGSEDIELMRGWRKQLIGDELRRVLSGELTIGVANGSLVVAPAA